jgi:hypothetical protein
VAAAREHPFSDELALGGRARVRVDPDARHRQPGVRHHGLDDPDDVRRADVDVEKQRAIELRDTLEEMLRGHPDLSRYQSLYIKPEGQARLTPDEIMMMREYSGLQGDARAYSKSQRPGKPVSPVY